MVSKDSTTIVEGTGLKELTVNRVAWIGTRPRYQVISTRKLWTSSNYQVRLSRIVECRYWNRKKTSHWRCFWTQNSRAAVSEGIVSGGEQLLWTFKAVDALELEGDFSDRRKRISRSQKNLRQIGAENAGLEGSNFIARLKSEERNWIHASTDECGKHDWSEVSEPTKKYVLPFTKCCISFSDYY